MKRYNKKHTDLAPYLRRVKKQKAFSIGLAPIQPGERSWNKWHFAALWAAIIINVPGYTLGGSLVANFGLSVGEALLAIISANLLILIPLLLIGRAGAKYGIPFPVLLRSSFGVVGSNLPALVRSLFACGWFGVQCLFGALALDLLLDKLLPFMWPALGGIGFFFSFIGFLAANVYIALRGFAAIKILVVISAPLLLAVTLVLLLWAWGRVDIAELLTLSMPHPIAGIASPMSPASIMPAILQPYARLLPFFLGALAWTTVALNIPDFTRYARTQQEHTTGQIIGLPLSILLFSMLGVVMTAATPAIFGETIADPLALVSRIDSPFWVILLLLLFLIATISTNVAANMVAPINAFQNLVPKRINWQRGVLLTATTGTLLVLWELLRLGGFISTQINMEARLVNAMFTYSALLGPIAGIIIADFYRLRRTKLNLPELYRDKGAYGRYNWAGILAFLLPAALATAAFTAGPGTPIFALFSYDGWFIGAALGFALYLILHRLLYAHAG